MRGVVITEASRGRKALVTHAPKFKYVKSKFQGDKYSPVKKVPGSIPNRVKPKTLKLVSVPLLLDTESAEDCGCHSNPGPGFQDIYQEV